MRAADMPVLHEVAAPPGAGSLSLRLSLAGGAAAGYGRLQQSAGGATPTRTSPGGTVSPLGWPWGEASARTFSGAHRLLLRSRSGRLSPSSGPRPSRPQPRNAHMHSQGHALPHASLARPLYIFSPHPRRHACAFSFRAIPHFSVVALSAAFHPGLGGLSSPARDGERAHQRGSAPTRARAVATPTSDAPSLDCCTIPLP
mmetsp:Transcript_22299/g.63407  ORF Transcript_22299/g.63407 Transcript_22299/m.63407 type:complete len:200 (+) Transcript_22299:211-810(+)